jgi:hypothetical protein
LVLARRAFIWKAAIEEHKKQYAETPTVCRETVHALCHHLWGNVDRSSHSGSGIANAITHFFGKAEVCDLDGVKNMWALLVLCF